MKSPAQMGLVCWRGTSVSRILAFRRLSPGWSRRAQWVSPDAPCPSPRVRAADGGMCTASCYPSDSGALEVFSAAPFLRNGENPPAAGGIGRSYLEQDERRQKWSPYRPTQTRLGSDGDQLQFVFCINKALFLIALLRMMIPRTFCTIGVLGTRTHFQRRPSLQVALHTLKWMWSFSLTSLSVMGQLDSYRARNFVSPATPLRYTYRRPLCRQMACVGTKARQVLSCRGIKPFWIGEKAWQVPALAKLWLSPRVEKTRAGRRARMRKPTATGRWLPVAR